MGPTQSHFSFDTYRRPIQALRIALERRTAAPVSSIKTTLDIDGKSGSLRSPSDGTERPYNGPPGYRLVLSGDHSDIHNPSRLPAGDTLVIEAPATALFMNLAKTVTQDDHQFYEFSLYVLNVCLWDNHGFPQPVPTRGRPHGTGGYGCGGRRRPRPVQP
mgnify:CR=1 FL=1